MRLLLLSLVATIGCSVDAKLDEQPFVSVTFAYSNLKPAPVSPAGGCEEGCGCNGTGEEKSGDGLAVVACRCPETCDCKQSKAAADPPLVPAVAPPATSQGKVICVNGQCYLVEPDGSRYRIVK